MLKGVEVHVVVTARDPAARPSPSGRRAIKHGRRLTFEDFRSRVLDGASETDYARASAPPRTCPAVLARWGARLPADPGARRHLPAAAAPIPECSGSGSPRSVGFDAARFAPAGPDSANASLGVAEIDLLRRVNVALDKRLAQPAYGQVVKQLYAQRLLAGRPASPRPSYPRELHDDLAVVAERWVKEIDRAGYVVHGDLGDLVPGTPATGDRAPGRRGRPCDQVDSRRRRDRRAARSRWSAAARRSSGSRRRATTSFAEEAQAAQAALQGDRLDALSLSTQAAAD